MVKGSRITASPKKGVSNYLQSLKRGSATTKPHKARRLRGGRKTVLQSLETVLSSPGDITAIQ
jgi:hypothetical protein